MPFCLFVCLVSVWNNWCVVCIVRRSVDKLCFLPAFLFYLLRSETTGDWRDVIYLELAIVRAENTRGSHFRDSGRITHLPFTLRRTGKVVNNVYLQAES